MNYRSRPDKSQINKYKDRKPAVNNPSAVTVGTNSNLWESNSHKMLKEKGRIIHDPSFGRIRPNE
jgi:hypothetical protein